MGENLFIHRENAHRINDSLWYSDALI